MRWKRVSNAFYSMLFSVVAVFIFFDMLSDFLFVIRQQFQVGDAFIRVRPDMKWSLVLIIIITLIINGFIIGKPKYSKYIFGLISGFFIGQGIHFVYYAVVTTIHENSVHPIWGYFILSLGIVRIFLTVLAVALMVFFYDKWKGRLNIKLYLLFCALSYCLVPIYTIMTILNEALFPWIFVLAYNAPLVFLFVKKNEPPMGN
ncbi:hypothetical protein J7I93_20665 [Bacillus sp. ISL-47]|uniref:hypothetical protein n=1 Tax=Bacillus sp. ISL-47 TaxID=2819130 RepID=UPI001BE68158|nr:hypothetical protein [Bacillus sp. ISL-47]MBT2690573.1 hypothetical protein [Bacillus sp. ISL-47]MBT2710904.1 hypothetical protein [Pseudomonas sp. ISL-84]